MKIEIAEPGRMTQSGSSLLKLIQNNNMPILDLLVRESIQNSLDAKNESDRFVTVEFLTGNFETKRLNRELEGIEQPLNRKYWKDSYKYVAVRDSNTVGLTGKLHYDEVTDNQYGNLLKLIYEISKPQEAEGAGGSWGLGKTVYFRVGIGLVIYYSRIINEKGDYESRLAASLVENEMDKESLIPVLHGKSKRGIAWWGESIGDNKTRPITDENYICKVLQIFGIEPYLDQNTGTTIIIPYINEEMLLENNQIEYKDGEDNTIRPFWRSNVEEYLKIAVQRWYAPRLNNVNYPYGKFLRALINHNGITKDNMEPAFQIIQALYNRAIVQNVSGDILDNSMSDNKAEKISLRKVLENTEAGTIAFAKVSRKLLKMDFPDNKPEPYMYFNCEIRDKEKNKPVISFTRKPGMVVSYEDVGNWVDGINASGKEEFIFGIFVLNSNNKLAELDSNYSLEEYVRKSEMADHTSWGDFSMGNINPRIVSKVQGQVISKISKEFSVVEEDNASKLNSGLGKMFGELLLPPENFGKKPSNGSGKTPSGKQQFEKHKNVMFGYDPSNTKYSSKGMFVKLILKSRGEIRTTGVKLAIDSENGPISANDWENRMGLYMPFEISESQVTILKLDGSSSDIKMNVSKEHLEENINGIKCVLGKTDKQAGYEIHIELENDHAIDMEISIMLQLHRKDVKPLFIVEKVEGDN